MGRKKMVRTEITVEVNSMEDILKRDFYFEVPLYQRNYSWKSDDHVEEFWTDLKNHFALNSRERYFFGTLMLVNTSESNDLYTIIDGQQRLTTSIILLTAFRDYFLEIDNQDEVDDLNACIFTETDKKPRLTLNVYNKNYFSDTLLKPEKINQKIKNLIADDYVKTKDKLLKNAYLVLADKILNFEKGNPDQAKELGKLKEHFLRYFTVVENLIVDLQKAYRIFENINNKGLHLAQSDLVKNHLFEIIDTQSQQLSSQERMDLIIESDEIWQSITNTLEFAKTDESVFLRYYLTAFVELVKKDEVYTTVKANYATKERVQEFLQQLEIRVSNLHKLVKPTVTDWGGDQTTVDNLVGLKSLGQGAMYPILLKGMEVFTGNDLKKLIILTTKFFFRAKTVCSRNFTDIEKRVDVICKKLRTDDEVKIKDIQELMFGWELYPEDDEFDLQFKKLTLSDAKARYALSELHYEMSGGRENAVLEISNKAQIEHIMPKSIRGTKWETDIKAKYGFTSKEELDDFKKANLDKIGNLTLLNNRRNIKNSNKPFSEKKLTYVDTQEVKMTQELATISEWDAESILERQTKFADIAKDVWNLKSSI